MLIAICPVAQSSIATISKSPGNRFAPSGIPCLPTDIQVADGLVAAAPFYRAMNGFAYEAGTTGGIGRKYFEVTIEDDIATKNQRPLRGSLREAIVQAGSSGGWIGFSRNLQGRTIAVNFPLRVPSNLTIDGGCAKPQVMGRGKGSIFYITGRENIVISRLRLLQTNQFGGNGDCVTVNGGSDRVWVAFNDISECRDGLVDVTQNGTIGPARTTIAYNRFSRHDKSILVSANVKSSPPWCAPNVQTQRDIDAGLYISLIRNMFLDTGQRHPRIDGNAYVHMYENHIQFARQKRPDQSLGAAYGSLAMRGAMLLVERSTYLPPSDGRRYRIVTNGIESRNISLACRSAGALRLQDIRYPDGHVVQSGHTRYVKDPPYALTSWTLLDREDDFGKALAPYTGVWGWENLNHGNQPLR